MPVDKEAGQADNKDDYDAEDREPELSGNTGVVIVASTVEAAAASALLALDTIVCARLPAAQVDLVRHARIVEVASEGRALQQSQANQTNSCHFYY